MFGILPRMSRPKEAFASPVALLLFLGTMAAGLAVDLLTKSLAAANLDSRPEWEVIPGLLHFTFTRNYGAVFGLGQGQTTTFIAVSILAIGFLTYLFALSGQRRFYQIVLGMLLAGVLGNFYDRLRFGYVRDMIHALSGITWPESIGRHLSEQWRNVGVFPWIFNVADSLLCVGVTFMIIYSFIHKPVESAKMDAKVESDERGEGH